MSTKGRAEDIAVDSQMPAADFGFVPLLRLLERMALAGGKAGGFATNPIGRYTPPASETVRLSANQSLAFPVGEVAGYEAKINSAGAKQWHVRVNFLGLTGSSGILPFHYSELVLRRLKLKDRALADFLDLFNHRLLSLFYQASIKYRLPLDYERGLVRRQKAGGDADTHTQVLLSLVGLGTSTTAGRLKISDEALIYHGGLFAQRVRTVDGLKRIIFNVFGMRAEVTEFVGQWHDLIEDVRTRLPGVAVPRGQNNQLGKTAMLGCKGWSAQGRIRISLGPLTAAQYGSLSPAGGTLAAIDQVVKMYLNDEHGYDFVMRVNSSAIDGPARLQKERQPTLGWSAWLGMPRHRDAGNATVDIPVSAHRAA